MQQQPGTSRRACYFQPDSFLGYYAVVQITWQSWFKGFCSFLNWMCGTPGLNEYLRTNDWGNYGVGNVQTQTSGIELRSKFCNVRFEACAWIDAHKVLCWHSIDNMNDIRLWAVRDDIAGRDVVRHSTTFQLPITTYLCKMSKLMLWSV